MNAPEVILVGASCRAAAEAVERLGRSSIAWDLFADRDTKDVCTVYQIDSFATVKIRDILERPKSIVLPCGGLENAYSLWEALEKHHFMLGPNVEQLRKLRDPFFLKSFCEKNEPNVKFPESSREPHTLCSNRRWIIKNAGSAGGLGIRDRDSIPLSSTEYYQEFINGFELSVTYSCNDDGPHLLQASTPVPHQIYNINCDWPPCYAGSIGPIALDDRLVSVLGEYFQSLSTSLNFQGVLQGDFIIRGEHLFLLEINPRWTASMEIGESLSPSSILSHFKAQDQHQPFGVSMEAPAQYPGTLIKRIVYADRLLLIDESASSLWMTRRTWQTASIDGDSFKYRLADIPDSGCHIEPGHPLCTVLVHLNEKLEWPLEGGHQLGKVQSILRSIDPLKIAPIDH